MPSMKGFHALKHLPEEKVTDKISRRVLVGDQEMIVWGSMKAGAHAAAHRHPNEQMFVMLSGRMEFRLGSDKRMCGPGDLGVIPGGALLAAKVASAFVAAIAEHRHWVRETDDRVPA